MVVGPLLLGLTPSGYTVQATDTVQAARYAAAPARLETASGTMSLNSAKSAERTGKGSLEHCIGLRNKIEKYTRLRRGGGNAQQMERWRSARRRHEDEFTDLRCRRFGRQLRSER